MNFVRSLILLLALTAMAWPARAQSPDEQYIRIYQTIQDADRLGGTGQGRAAAAKYLEAQQALRRFQASYPAWNERVVSYRLDYVASKLEPLTVQLPPAATARTNVSPSTPSSPTTPPKVVTTPGRTAPAVTPSPTTPAPTTPVPAEPSPAMANAMAELQQQLSSAQAEMEQLRTENNRLGAKLKEALSVQPAAMDPRELAKAEDRIRLLEKDNELLRVRLRSATNAPAAPAEGESVAELKSKVAQQNEAIAALRAENEILKKQGNSPAPSISASVLADTQQLEALRARVATLEAKPVPYSEEELALMSKPASIASANTLVANTTTAVPPAEGMPRKASRELPPGAGPLVAAAERAFAARDYAEAERKYLDVLRQDENNVSILANLASVQLELGRVDEAEKNARKALELDANDYFAWYVLGRIRFNEEKLDEAVDALSRSAKANPEYAETQNYLGIVLSEKGLRGPAETALRRAVQLQPNHPAAHNNLAVVYATQTPPALALAKWHYQKALAAGHSRNAELEKLLNAGK